MGGFADIAGNIAVGLQTATQPINLIYCFIGVTLGMLVGVLPGIGALTAVSLLLPITFHLDPTAAIVMLAGVFYGTTYGGSTAAILLNLPGTPSSAVTCMDGYPMARQGRAGVALFMTTIASFVGGSIGIAIIMLFSPAIAQLAIAFGPAEYFSVMLLGLVAASTISVGSPIKGLAMVIVGILLGLVGLDIITGLPRFTFGQLGLYEGLRLIAIAMGIFGLAEVIATIGSGDRAGPRQRVTLASMVPTRDDARRSVRPMLRGSALGAFLGALPGVGGVIAAFMAYAVERRVAREPDRFGKGAIEGITAPEAANNAADQTAFIPTLTLGIPGNVVMALMIGALIIHGITPGPRLIVDRPELFWGLVMSFWIGNFLLLILNIPLIGIWVRLLQIPFHYLYPAILMFVCMGVFSVYRSATDVIVVGIFGMLGYGMRLLGFPAAPLLLGFVLGPLVERHLQRALLMSGGDFAIFFTRPISAVFMVATIGIVLLALWSFLRRSHAPQHNEEDDDSAADRPDGRG